MTGQSGSDIKKLVGLLVRANELRCRQDYRAALPLYIEAYEQSGESSNLTALIAQCYFELALSPHGTDQDGLEAVAWMRKAIALAPNDARLHADLGQILSLATLDYDEAAREYREAIALNPHQSKALIGAASLYGVPNAVVTLEEAIDWLEWATRLEPHEPSYHARLGDLYRKAGRQVDSEQEWLKALQCPQPLSTEVAQTILKTLRKE